MLLAGYAVELPTSLGNSVNLSECLRLTDHDTFRRAGVYDASLKGSAAIH